MGDDMPALWERLWDGGTGKVWTLQDHKHSVARALEDLLNSRQALADALTDHFAEARRSILTYGLRDFSALSISCADDRRKICNAVALAIERHEPRLRNVRATLRPDGNAINRLSFVIQASLHIEQDVEAVQFDGTLEPSAQRCTVSPRRN